MATKTELLATLSAAGVEGYTMATPKDELVEAVAALDPIVDRRKGI